MTFDEYQTESRKTVKYPDAGNNLIYPALGLAGEVGEFCEKLKKILRRDFELTEEYKKNMVMEASDCLWYLAQLCSELGVKFSDVAKMNLEKLNSRMERGVIQGNGDNR